MNHMNIILRKNYWIQSIKRIEKARVNPEAAVY